MALVTALSIVIPVATLAISNMATLTTIESESIFLFRSHGMILVFLKEKVINGSIGDMRDPRGTSLPV
jgi:hypothetical protein